MKYYLRKITGGTACLVEIIKGCGIFASFKDTMEHISFWSSTAMIILVFILEKFTKDLFCAKHYGRYQENKNDHVNQTR